MGYCDSAFSSIFEMNDLAPVESARTSIMPMIPMLPANDVRNVRPFLLIRFVKDSENAVSGDIDAFLRFFFSMRFSARLAFFAPDCSMSESAFSSAAVFAARSAASSLRHSSRVYSFVSPTMTPSDILRIRVAYSSASCELCVTMTIRWSFEISFSSSITSTPLSLSSAPVGSSARMISGLLTMARAIATRCICPPESCDGCFLAWAFSPTLSSASSARAWRSSFVTPASVIESSTFF